MDYKEQLLKAVENHMVFEGRQENAISKDALHIGYGVDNNYVRCMAASIASICENNKNENLIFHVLTGKLNDENVKKLKQVAEDFSRTIHVYHINEDAFRLLPTQEHLPVSTYYRFILPMLLQVPKVLYIDADIICMSNIKNLFLDDSEKNIISAVPDVKSLACKRNAALGLENHKYFNAGVLVIDVEKWNDYDVVSKVMEALASNPGKFRYLDQDALNLVLIGKIKYLDRKYNSLNVPDMVCEGIVLLHFAAHPKPWNIAWPISNACNEFTRDIYHEYEQMTPWKDCPPLLPRNYKEMKIYAQCLLKKGNYLLGFSWYIRYIKMKFAAKF